jgi:Flp pilus assembly pilin Flp
VRNTLATGDSGREPCDGVNAMSRLSLRRGATAIEYAMIASLIGVAIIVALLNLQTVVEVIYNLVQTLTEAAIG